MNNTVKILSIVGMMGLGLIWTNISVAQTDASYYKQYKKLFISEQQAAMIAQARLNGGDVKSVHFDRDGDVPLFKVKVRTRQNETVRLTIHAGTGKVILMER